MEQTQVNLYVVYSGAKPIINDGAALIPAFSPTQNYSELYVQKQIASGALSPKDMVGFFHLRRYLDCAQLTANCKKRPYRFQKFPRSADYTAKALADQLSPYDIIAPIPEQTGLSVRARYGQYDYLRKADLDTVIDILLQQHPEYSQSAEQYLSSTQEYYGNLYIMSAFYFAEYSAWLFDILSTFDNCVTDQLPRTPGYLAERLFGIWLTQKQIEGTARIAFAPRVHFYGYDDATHHFKKDKMLSFFFPAGSKRRFWLRGVMLHGK